MEPTYLFTYGTLMQGFDNPLKKELLAHTSLVGRGRMEGELYRISWYPGAIHTPGSGSFVWGEIYIIRGSELLFPLLDEYEDISESLYVREQVSVTLEDQSTVLCWVYLYNQPLTGLKRIWSGDFRDLPNV